MTTPPPSATPTATATAEPVRTAELHLPDGPTGVLAQPDAPARALAASQTYYASAPVAVLAPADDVAAQVRAAAVAVAVGAPLLLSGADEAVSAELTRLGTLAVVTVGPVDIDTDDVPVIEASEDDEELAAQLRVSWTPVPLPAAGAELAAVQVLDRAAPTLPSAAASAPGEAPPTESKPTESKPTAPEPTEPTPSTPTSARPTAGSSPSPSASPTGEADTSSLPLTEMPDALVGGLLLTTGDPGDLASVATARSAGVPVLTVPSGDPRTDSATVQAFAAAAPTNVTGLGATFGDPDTLAWKTATAATGVELPGGGQLVLTGRRYVAMYGTPSYPALGILGEQDLPSSIARAQGLAASYQPLTTDLVVPAFEIIATVASAGAGGDGNYSNELPLETLVPWVEAAAAAGVYVVIDLQPGRTDFVTQAQLYEPLLKYPNVGLALDPEWRLLPDQVHLRQIGSVTVDEVNAVAAYLAQLTRTHALPQKLFVLHQFKHSMVQGRERVDMSHPELAVMVHVDGQGGQGAKAGTWASLQQGAPAGMAWGWKNFIDEDVPMLTPEQTYTVTPVPHLVSYQ